MVGDIDFQVISATENSNKFPKNWFWQEKSVEDMVTLGPTAQAKTSETEGDIGIINDGIIERKREQWS
jgi:hypothetical protein